MPKAMTQKPPSKIPKPILTTGSSSFFLDVTEVKSEKVEVKSQE
jgi:hypothetical protein